MSAYSYEVFIREFVRRTKVNHRIILNRYEENPKLKYEVTQLINSLFGLLIVPNEKYKYRKSGKGVAENYLKNMSEYDEILEIIQELKKSGKYYNSYKKKGHEVSDFINHMRNSLAHSGEKGLHFLPFEEGKEITGIIFYDTDKEYGGNSEFCVEMTIEEIRMLSESIADMYSKIESEEEAEEKRKHYEAEIARCRSLMANGKT